MRIVGDFYGYLWPGVTMAEMQQYGNNSNSYIVANALSGNKHLLVDPGMVVNEARQNCLERLIFEIEKDGFRIEDTIICFGFPGQDLFGHSCPQFIKCNCIRIFNHG